MASTKSRYSETIVHSQLGKTKLITGTDYYVVQAKARAQMHAWDMQWQKFEEKRLAKEAAKIEAQERRLREKEAKEKERLEKSEQRELERAEKAAYKEARQAEAQACDGAAKELIALVEGILQHTLGVDDRVDWSSLKHSLEFVPPASLQEPRKPERPVLRSLPNKLDLSQFNEEPPEPTNLRQKPTKPVFSEQAYEPQLGLMASVATSKQKKKEMAQARWRKDWDEWQEECKRIDAQNLHIRAHALKKHQEQVQQEKEVAIERWKAEAMQVHQSNQVLERAYLQNVASWEQQHNNYIQQLNAAKQHHANTAAEHNQRIDTHQRAYEAGEAEASFDYFDLVLRNSEYPDSFNPNWAIQYQDDSKTLIVDYDLPNLDNMPSVKGVKYISTRDEIREEYLTDKQRQSLYDSTLYQIALRTVHELFEADYANALESVVFNGLVSSLDTATGNDVTACVMSLQANREEFLSINLGKVDAKACFRKLKGVGSSQLHSLAPVAPIMKLDTNDERFVDAYGVAAELDGATNLAEMHWEDFEHLVRELFEKEFQASGGEVKITRASSDGGVDAVAFDPDPIRGGKIVIQAKRYTNTVGVAAVRDLYGTTLNEGATKGILVSTANYGPDAISFAKDKPLTLLNGANLLSLLQKHGHKAYIDTKEAKAKRKAQAES